MWPELTKIEKYLKGHNSVKNQNFKKIHIIFRGIHLGIMHTNFQLCRSKGVGEAEFPS